MHTKTVIALDVGRSGVKVVAHASGLFNRFIFPSIVSPAIEIADESTAKKAQLETVSLHGKSYFIGDTARLQGGAGASVGLSHDWIEKPEYQALVLGAMKKLEQLGVRGLDDAYMVIGAPSALYSTQKKLLEEKTSEVVDAEIKVLPQPMGGYLAYAHDTNGVPKKEIRSDDSGRLRSWAVIDVGHYTTDFLLMREGEYIERCAGSCEGVNLAVEHLVRIMANKKIQISALQSEMAIQTGKLNHFGVRDVSAEVDEAANHVVSKIISRAESLFSSEVATLDGVLLAGGGEKLVAKQIKSQWPHAVELEEARMAVAEGFCRFGVGLMKSRARKHLQSLQ